MKQVRLHRVHMVGFRSFVHPTLINLTVEPGLKLISGDNQVEPSLGGNGCGKSSFWDAVCFGLFGTSIKGLRASDLVSYGRNTLTVALELSVDNALHVIKRTAPPMRITLDDEPVEQVDIENLIGRSKARFLHSEIFGQAVPLFIDLPVPQRGDLLDEVLDLELWMQAADRASHQHSSGQAELAIIQREIARLKGQLEGLPDPLHLQALEDDFERQRSSRLRGLIDRYEGVEDDIRQLRELLDDTTVDVEAIKARYDKQRDRVGEHQRHHAALQAELVLVNRDTKFFEDNKACPVCHQAISPDFADRHVKRMLAKSAELQIAIGEVAGKIATVTERRDILEHSWQKAVQQVAEQQRLQAVIRSQITGKERESHDLQQQAVRERNAVNPYRQQREDTEHRIADIQQALTTKQQDERDKTSQLAKLNFWRQGFRRVRLFCLDNVLAELEIETRNSLLALGLIDWKIGFKTATETKSGNARLGVQVDVSSPYQQISNAGSRGGVLANSFDRLSGGESQRARLAVSLGLANLIQRWSGVRFNLEVWDEPTAWLSDQGVEDLLETFRYRADQTSKSIWLCDHRALQSGAFAELYLVSKTSNGSQWERV